MMGRGYGYGMMGGFGWFEMLFLFFFGALVIAGIVLLIIWAVRASTHHPTASGAAPPGVAGHDEAVAIAKRRLASGEITKDQYDEIMRALDG
ncbi:MAG: SHOCT domain-containing protein [Actinobacteria bacterium]|nr:SHOCT domain-containing protein [Actinomycetota bacterium]